MDSDDEDDIMMLSIASVALQSHMLVLDIAKLVAARSARLVAELDEPRARRSLTHYRDHGDIHESFFETAIMARPSELRRWLRVTKPQFDRLHDEIELPHHSHAGPGGRPCKVLKRHMLGMLLLALSHGETV